MRRSLGYRDALTILGVTGPVVAALDKALGGALLVATAGGSELAISLFDAKAEASNLFKSLSVGFKERITGLDRYTRTQRLHAAHTVIVISAYFEALDLAPIGVSPRRFRLTSQDRMRVGGLGSTGADFVQTLLNHDVPLPGSQRSYDEVLTELRGWYREMSDRLVTLLRGLAEWDRMSESDQKRATGVLTRDLPGLAIGWYEEFYRNLEVDAPEFALWANHAHQLAMSAKLRQVAHSLERVEGMLTGLTGREGGDRRRRSLVTAHQAALRQPVLHDSDTPTGMRIPMLEEIYVDPDFKVREVDAIGAPADEAWWEPVPSRRDLSEFLSGYLTGPDATQAPLLVLGQPGAGKSVLTQVLAARLPLSDFLVVRVLLREAPADADLQEQIEFAIRQETGESLTWPELADAADGALPVVLLDGFDELLQATGVSQTDYLTKVSRFQQREAKFGRPVAVLVTTRIAVADRARVPPGAVALRLEPFRDEQIDAWIAVWNAANEGYFRTTGIRALAAQTVLGHRRLSSQPLLLLMLALYEATGNRLTAADGALNQAALYESLLRVFATREVRKLHDDQSDGEIQRLAEVELHRLSIVAFAMFNRSRQWVSVADIDADIAALLQDTTARAAGLRAALTQSEIVIGRFFFVQKAQATRDGRRLETYEFLHATFGEFLVARMTYRVLEDLARQDAANAMSVVGMAGRQDGLCHALLSFAPLTARNAVVQFFMDLVDPTSGLDALLLSLVADLDNRTDTRFGGYRPIGLAAPYRYALYSANLVLLTVAVRHEIRLDDLLRGSDDPIASWRRLTLLWQAAMSPEEWRAFTRLIRVDRDQNDEGRFAVVGLRPAAPQLQQVLDPMWSFGAGNSSDLVWQRGSLADAIDQQSFILDQPADLLVHALEPVGPSLGPTVSSFVKYGHTSGSVFRLLLSLWLAGVEQPAPPGSGRELRLVNLYAGGVQACVADWANWDRRTRSDALTLMLSCLARDAAFLPTDRLAGFLRDIIQDMQHRQHEQDVHIGLMLDAALAGIAVSTSDSDGEAFLNIIRELLTAATAEQYLTTCVRLVELRQPFAKLSTYFSTVEGLFKALPLQRLKESQPAAYHHAKAVVQTMMPKIKVNWP